MSGKNQNQESEEFSIEELFKPITPLRQEAFQQLDGNEDNFYEWAVLAAAAHHLAPEVALKKLLPDQIDDTIHELGPDFQDDLADFLEEGEEDEE